jgi:hypothetical protein
VRFDPDHIDEEPIAENEKEEFRAWYKKAEQARRKAVTKFEATGVAPNETQEIWRDHKKWLLRNKFFNKCAYCEKSLTDIPSPAEHWRPKRAITDAPDHPGYFWLAYSWFNLLPSCDMCNSYGAKHNEFPVMRSHIFRVKLTQAELDQLKRPADAIRSEISPDEYYLGPHDLDDLEGPLLLHPYVDQDSTADLEFSDLGAVRGRTTKGELSVKVFRLDRTDVTKLRRKAADDLRTSVQFRYAERVQLAQVDHLTSLHATESEILAMINERTHFSVAFVQMLKQIVAKKRSELEAEGI